MANNALNRLKEPDTYPGINVEAIRNQLLEDKEGRAVLNDIVLTNLATAEENLFTMRANTRECIQEHFRDFEGNPIFANASV